MAIPQLTSRIDKVKVYAAGATVIRVAELRLRAGELPEQVEVAGLPVVLDDSTVRVRVEAEEAIAAIATDVRIGLAVPPRQETQPSPTDEEMWEAVVKVQKLEDIIGLIDNEITVLLQLEVPNRPHGEAGKAPPPSPLGARLALANFSDEQIRDRLQEKRDNQEKLRKAKEHLQDLQQKRSDASNAKKVKPRELRKTVIVGLSYEAEGTMAGQKLVVEYFVPGARWTPSYVCRLDSKNNNAAIALRALICQRTGEDWSGVSLELSTAQPLTWCELPELPSLRLGRAQPMPHKSGWRLPPIGAKTLFEDYDRQKQVALAEVRQRQSLTTNDFSSPRVQSLPELKHKKIVVESVTTYEEMTSVDEDDDFADLGSLQTQNLQSARQAVPIVASSAADSIQASPAPRETTQMARMAKSTAMKRSMGPGAMKKSAASKKTSQMKRTMKPQQEASTSLLTYSLMHMGAADDSRKRGKLSLEQQHQAYLEILQRQDVTVSFNLTVFLQQIISNAERCLPEKLPPGGIDVR